MGARRRTPRLGREHLALIARIYDVVLEPAAWPSILEELSFHAGAKAANLLVSDRIHPEVRVTEASPYLDLALLTRYAAEFARYEVKAIEGLMLCPTQRWIPVEDLIDGPIEDLPSTQWLHREYGLLHRACARLNASKGWFDVVTLNMAADRGQITKAEMEIGSVFLPHLAKAVEIGRSFQILRARFRRVLDALDRLHLGVFVLGPLGHVALRNREAQRILDLADGISIDSAGRLRPKDETAAESFRRGVRRAIETVRAEGNTPETLLAVPRPSGKDAFLAEVSPLRGGGAAAQTSASEAIVFLIDPDHRSVVSTTGMQALYALTEAESEVLRLLVDGFSSSAMAEIRGVSVHTVISQTKRVLSKTGTKGRSALVRLALSVNPPIDAVTEADKRRLPRGDRRSGAGRMTGS